MCLVEFNDKCRRSWMFPRNIRQIHPWKITQILSMMHLQLQGDSWSGNQDLQDNFTKNLEKLKLKRAGVQSDPNSGGARTYFSQLASLGLLFTRSDKSTWLTIAGQDLVDGNHSPSAIIRNQILNYQYPSIYSKGQNVKIHEDLKVKPFLFVLSLLMDKDIKYMSDEELRVPIIYGHNFDCFDLCKNKILKFRETNQFVNIIDNPNEDIYTPRTKERTIEKSLIDLNHIANTCKNYLESCSLVISQYDEESKRRVITINEGVIDEINIAMKIKNKFIPIHSDEQFQRKYGAWNRTKDTRSLVKKPENEKTNKGESFIHALFAEYAGKNLVLDVPDDFIDSVVEYGFKKSFILKTIQPYLVNSLSFFEQKFIELSTGGTKTALDFEKAVTRLFREKLKYITEHTGQKHRATKIGGYSDIFIKEVSKRYCAIIDTKASPNYTISSTDYHTMKDSYIPSTKELNPTGKETFGFCTYVAGGFTETMNERVLKLSNDSGLRFSAIKAYDLLKLSNYDINIDDQERVTDIFRQKKLLYISDFNSLV